MIERDKYKNRVELIQGTLDMLILRTLRWGPQHGYGIVQALRVNSGEVLQVETGSLYPRCIGWSGKGGYVPSGSKARVTSVRSFTALRRPARSS
jgi:Transcriptional regulator PadR-like family